VNLTLPCPLYDVDCWCSGKGRQAVQYFSSTVCMYRHSTGSLCRQRRLGRIKKIGVALTCLLGCLPASPVSAAHTNQRKLPTTRTPNCTVVLAVARGRARCKTTAVVEGAPCLVFSFAHGLRGLQLGSKILLAQLLRRET
jgi:hypothetical protein